MSAQQNQDPKWKTQTKAIHCGEGIDPVSRASAPSPVLSSTFVPDELAGFSALDPGNYSGHVYARFSNPTTQDLEDKLCALEDAEAACCFASGMGATHALLAGRLNNGDHLIVSDTNYGGTAELVRDSLPRWGIEVALVDTSDLDAIKKAIKPNTKMLWIESPANPIMRLTDIQAASELAHSMGVRDVAIDSTFASPIATKPLALGVDFVIHSLTKYICGHGDAMGGAVLGRRADIETLGTDARVHYGGVLSPFNAWLIARGAATLPMRMEAHQKSAFTVARFLEKHSNVARVLYPGLESHPQHALACKQMSNFSGMLSFQVREDGKEVARRMIKRLRFVHHAVSLGHVRTLIYWIPTAEMMTSTFRLDAEGERRYREFAGDGLFRLSVGIEDGEDICEDLERALTL